MNYCPNCGAKLSSKSNYCPKCGQEIKTKRDSGNTNNQQTPKAAPSFDYSQNRRHAKVKAYTPEKGNFENDSTVEFSDLHPNAIWLFFLRYAGKSSILIPLLVIGAILMPLLWILLGAYFLATYVAARVTYTNYQYKVTPTAFIKEYGIIHKNHATIPFATIENININRNLIDRLLGLAHVEIETAGTSGNAQKDIIAGVAATAEGYIPGLSRQEAYDLRDLMLLRAHKSRG